MGIEIEFLHVGNGSGDAICLRYGNELFGYQVHVVDGGHTNTSETIINHIEKYYGADTTINHIVLSHADDDHARGLVKIVEHFNVENIWMNRPWLYARQVIDRFHGNYTEEGLVKRMRELHPYLIDIENAAAAKLFPPVIHEAFQGASVGECLILAPSRDRYISLIPELEKTPSTYREGGALGSILAEMAKKVTGFLEETWDVETLSNNPSPPTSASNETCIVQLCRYENRAILLTADVGPVGLAEAASYAQAHGLLASPDLVQVPHHGSRRNVTPEALDTWLGPSGGSKETTLVRGHAICSVGMSKDDFPRPAVTNAFMRRGYPIYSTRAKTLAMRYGLPQREGWTSSTPEPFHDQVEA